MHMEVGFRPIENTINQLTRLLYALGYSYVTSGGSVAGTSFADFFTYHAGINQFAYQAGSTLANTPAPVYPALGGTAVGNSIAVGARASHVCWFTNGTMYVHGGYVSNSVATTKNDLSVNH